MPVKKAATDNNDAAAEEESKDGAGGGDSASNNDAKKISDSQFDLIKDRPQECVIMVGGPGSGKSTFVTTKMKNYVRVNNDTFKNLKKCAKVCREALEQGKSVVIDNTNPTKE